MLLSPFSTFTSGYPTLFKYSLQVTQHYSNIYSRLPNIIQIFTSGFPTLFKYSLQVTQHYSNIYFRLPNIIQILTSGYLTLFKYSLQVTHHYSHSNYFFFWGAIRKFLNNKCRFFYFQSVSVCFFSRNSWGQYNNFTYKNNHIFSMFAQVDLGVLTPNVEEDCGAYL